MRCRHCGYDNPPGAKSCAQCFDTLRPARRGFLAFLLSLGRASPAMAIPGPYTGVGQAPPARSAPVAGGWLHPLAGLRFDTATVVTIAVGLVVSLGVAFYGYSHLSVGGRLAAAGIFALAWAILLALAPFLVRFLLAGIVLLLLGGAYFLAAGLGLNLLTAVLYSFVAVAVLGLALLLLPFIPGLVAAVALYRFMAGTPGAVLYAIAAMVVVTGAMFAVWASFRDYFIPFAEGFLWSFLTGAVAHRIALTLVAGSQAHEWVELMSRLSITALMATVGQLPALVEKLLLLDQMPAAVGLWLFVVSAVVGLFSMTFRNED